MIHIFLTFVCLLVFTYHFSQQSRDLSIKTGILSPGKIIAITDVEGVLVGQKNIINRTRYQNRLESNLPHNGNIFQKIVPGIYQTIKCIPYF